MNRVMKLQVLFLCVAISGASAQVVASHAPSLTTESSGNVQLHPVGKPVARVNGTVLTDIDLVREEYSMFPYARQHNGIPTSMEPGIRSGAMKMIIFEELVYQEAKHRQMTIPPTQLDRAVAQFKKQFSSNREYQDFLKQEFHGSSALVRARVERSLLIEKLLSIEVTNKSVISLAEEKAYYTTHPDRFRTSEAFEFQSISIIAPQNADSSQAKEARKRAESALKQAKATKSYEEFGVLAEKTSDDDFRVMMGDHKLADRSKLPPVIVKALDGMKPGQTSDIVEFGKNAYTILRLNSHVPAATQSFDSVKLQLKQQMAKDKAESLRSAFSKALSKNAKIETL